MPRSKKNERANPAGIRLTKAGTPDKRYTAGANAGTTPTTAGGGDTAETGTGDGARLVDRDSGSTRDSNGRFTRGGGSANSANAGERSARGTFRSRIRDAAGFDPGDAADTGDATGPHRADAASDAATPAGNLGAQANANVNPPGKARGGVRGTFTPQAAERLVVGSFGIIATVRRRPYWAIQAPAVEVRPWAADLAELLNTASEYLPLPYVQAGAVFGSGIAVAIGLGMLVLPRMQADGMRAERERMAAPPPPPEPARPEPSRNGASAPPPRHSGGAEPRPARVVGIFPDEGLAA